MGYIKYKEKKYKSATIKLSRDSDFNALLKEFNRLFFSGIGNKIEHIQYAVLELVNNSIRAHKEQNTSEYIILNFHMETDALTIRIKDAGGGFDTSTLPYDIHNDVNDIDMNNHSFQEYRERHGYNRFGMGLLVTKRTFHEFLISFYDEEGEKESWSEGTTIGTIITMRSRFDDE